MTQQLADARAAVDKSMGQVNAARAFLTTDSGFPVHDLEQALRTNRPFTYEYQSSKVSVLFGPEYWIGRDAQSCQIARPDDLLVNARHARLYRNAKGEWHVENNKSLNGLWLRVEQMTLTGNCQFRLGEQRFLFRVL